MRSLCLALAIAVAALHLTPSTATALIEATVDEDRTFSNVGALMAQFLEGNPFGLPPGTVVGLCTGVLIHKRVFLSAGHCVAPGVFGLPPGVRIAITFSADAFDVSQWIDVNPAPGTQVVHATFPLPCFPGDCPFNDVDGLHEPGISRTSA
jgi:hypothetical protein